MKYGKFKNIEFFIHEDPKLAIFYWRWGHYGAQVLSLDQCWEGIRRAAGEWERDNDGNWIHSNEEIKHEILGSL